MRVLVVDDSDTNRDLLITFLGLPEGEAIGTSDPFEVERILGENPRIRLLISDLEMPSMWGDDLHAKIRVMLEARNIVFIAISSAFVEEGGSIAVDKLRDEVRDAYEYFDARAVPMFDKLAIGEKLLPIVQRLLAED